MIYLRTKNLCKNDFDGVKNYYGSHFSQIIQKLPKTSSVLTIAVYLVRLTICLFSGMVRINFFDCTCFHFDGYKYFVEYVKCSSHRSKKSKSFKRSLVHYFFLGHSNGSHYPFAAFLRPFELCSV